MDATITGPDGQERCRWCAATPEYLAYHDSEWGYPVSDDRRLFEKLSRESFQSGLSWRTILAKRENFRAAFAGFDFDRIADFTEDDVARLLGDAGIVRHRGKIEAVIPVEHPRNPDLITDPLSATTRPRLCTAGHADAASWTPMRDLEQAAGKV